MHTQFGEEMGNGEMLALELMAEKEKSMRKRKVAAFRQ